MHHDALHLGVRDDPRVNLARIDRIAYAIGGLGLIALGLRRGTLGRVALGGIGVWLLQQAYCGRNPMLAPLGVRVHRAVGDGSQPETIHVRESVSIGCTPDEVYRFWRDFRNVPRFATHIDRVEEIDATHSRWTARPSTGGASQWNSELLEDKPGHAMRWRATRGGRLVHYGGVRFESAGDRGTTVNVVLNYVPPAGASGAAISRLIGHEPKPLIREGLRRLRQILETGEIPSTAGQPAGGGRQRERQGPTR